jgi:hypothetical protein
MGLFPLMEQKACHEALRPCLQVPVIEEEKIYFSKSSAKAVNSVKKIIHSSGAEKIFAEASKMFSPGCGAFCTRL